MYFSNSSAGEFLPRTDSAGCWTGFAADLQMIKSLEKKTMPLSYLEQYPRNRARSLNTWLSRFGIYTAGNFFELDRRGSALVKALIVKSHSERGYVVRVTGRRKGNKILVESAAEIASAIPPEHASYSSAALRKEFAVMGI